MQSRDPQPPEILTESIQAGGDIIIDEVYITTNKMEVDIRDFCVDIEIYEDIFSNVMVGEATIADAAGLISRNALAGGELFTIHARTPSFPNSEIFAIKRSFIIYAVIDRTLLKDRQQLYKIKFISPEGMSDNQILVSRTYRGTTDSIVERVFNDYVRSARYIRDGQRSQNFTPLFIPNKPHKTSLTFTAPNWTPFKIINWVANRSQSGKGNGNDILFFESNKQFYFGSISEIMEGQRNNNLLMGEYFYTDAAIRDPGAGNFSYSFPNIDRAYSTIQAINVPKMFDVLKGQDFGHYAGTMATYDLLLKKYKENVWDYYANWNKFVHQEDYAMSNGKVVTKKGNTQTFGPGTLRSPNTFRAFRAKHYMMFDDYPDNKVEAWALQRNSQLYTMSDIKVEINVAGRTDAEVGRLVYLHFPVGSEKTAQIQQNFDPYMSGVYMITAIRHHISLVGKHRMSMELVKDSFKTPLK
jgi:hypothetical protein